MELLSTEEVARRLNVSTSHVTTLINKERLEGQKVGSSWVVTLDGLTNYQKNRKVKQRGRSYPGRRRRRTDD